MQVERRSKGAVTRPANTARSPPVTARSGFPSASKSAAVIESPDGPKRGKGERVPSARPVRIVTPPGSDAQEERRNPVSHRDRSTPDRPSHRRRSRRRSERPGTLRRGRTGRGRMSRRHGQGAARPRRDQGARHRVAAVRGKSTPLQGRLAHRRRNRRRRLRRESIPRRTDALIWRQPLGRNLDFLRNGRRHFRASDPCSGHHLGALVVADFDGDGRPTWP